MFSLSFFLLRVVPHLFLLTFVKTPSFVLVYPPFLTPSQGFPKRLYLKTSLVPPLSPHFLQSNSRLAIVTPVLSRASAMLEPTLVPVLFFFCSFVASLRLRLAPLPYVRRFSPPETFSRRMPDTSFPRSCKARSFHLPLVDSSFLVPFAVLSCSGKPFVHCLRDRTSPPFVPPLSLLFFVLSHFDPFLGVGDLAPLGRFLCNVPRPPF